CVIAVSEVIAQNNPEILRAWGKEFGKTIMGSVYKRAIQERNPKQAVEQFVYVFQNMFNFARMKTEEILDNEMLVSFEEFDPDFEAWYNVSIGWLEQTIESCVSKAVRIRFTQKTWEGAPMTQFRVSWDA
ncbi:MAG TPA: DUF2378 family protein, partial [Deltaproteobacteria bacterium]|nr:DUF2378 family protein [Deltaproteobacteria bacterium]